MASEGRFVPENLVRGLLKIGGRTIVGRIRAAGPDGVEVQTLETLTMGEGILRVMGPPAELPVIWSAFVTRIEGGALVAWPDESVADSQWPRLRSILGLPDAARLPLRRIELPSQPFGTRAEHPSQAHSGSRVEHPSQAHSASRVEHPSQPSGGRMDPSSQPPGSRTPPPARPRQSTMPPVSAPPAIREPVGPGERSSFTTDTLLAARGRGLVEPQRHRATVVHLPARSVAVALGRSLSELSPMIEIEGAPALRPRDVFVARVPVQGTSILLEATVVTVRGGRARVRLSIPTGGVRSLLEGGASS